MQILGNILVPILAGILFLVFALQLKGQTRRGLAFQAGYWGSLFFAVYLVLRPVQLLGPHPWPLVLSNIREILLEAVAAPSFLVACLAWAVGDEHARPWSRIIFGVGIVGAVVFCFVNAKVIGGSSPIFEFSGLTFHDGLWFENPALGNFATAEGRTIHQLMTLLVFIRTAIPIGFCLIGWGFVHYKRDRLGPQEDGLRRRLLLISWAIALFPISMLAVSVSSIIFSVPNQWWIYYFGALASGILAMAAMKIPIPVVQPTPEG